MLKSSSNTMSSSGSQRPGLGDRPAPSSRRLVVDFDSDNLLSMEDIRENVRLTASRLLNDDLDSSDEEDYDGEHDQLPHAEDARIYAGRLLEKNKSARGMSKQQSIRKPINILRSVRMMKDMRKTSDPTFTSDVDAMTMELDMDDDLPRRKRISRHTLYCILGSLAFIAVATTIIFMFQKVGGKDSGAGPVVLASPPPPPPAQVDAPPPPKGENTSGPSKPASEQLQTIIDLLVKQGISDSTALNTEGTSQRQAVDWMANTDAMEYNPNDDQSRVIQRYAIVVLYFALNGPEWKHQVNFLSQEDVCSWFRDIPEHDVGDVYSVGITCNGYLQVETILLPGNNLVGSLPPELSVLTALDFLSLKHNKINGPIPESLQTLSSLEYFDVQYNEMTGTLPSWLGGTMANLRDLSLSDNQFEGELPESMVNMEHLTTLAIDDNNFSGDLTSVVNTMAALRFLYADNNAFNSKIDFAFMTELMNLEELDLSGNELTCGNELPLHLFLMQGLRVLDLHDNALECSILDAIPSQSNLQFLSLYGNYLSGTIPQTIHKLSGLTHLDLSRNLFTGAPPDSISYLESLRYLYLSDNLFAPGGVPDFYQDLIDLEEFSMAKAKRTGTIPEWLVDLDNLMLLDLSENELTGTVPDLIFDLPDLRFLLLHRNQLTGSVQEGLLRADKLDMLTTDRNEITDDWTQVCELGRPEFLSADCGGNFEQVFCTCCTVCCEESNPTCNDEIVLANLDARWENNFSRTAYDFGPNSIFEGDDEVEYDGGDER